MRLRDGSPAVVWMPRASPAEQRVLLLCYCLADQRTGEIEGGKGKLVEMLGTSDPEHLRRTLASLEEQGLIRRGGQPRGTRVWLVLSRFSAGVHCAGCDIELVRADGRPAQGTWCRKCRQTVGHPHRAWRVEAVRLAVEGRSPPAIATVLNRPLWANRDGEGLDDDGGAVVPVLREAGLLSSEWEAADERRRKGDVVDG